LLAEIANEVQAFVPRKYLRQLSRAIVEFVTTHLGQPKGFLLVRHFGRIKQHLDLGIRRSDCQQTEHARPSFEIVVLFGDRKYRVGIRAREGS
jgi:hypothetical protein